MRTNVELQKAIEQGYVVKELYHYGKKGRVFQYYVEIFLRIKQEASGFLKHCFHENRQILEHVVEFLKSYAEHERIQLDRKKIVRNEGLQTM